MCLDLQINFNFIIRRAAKKGQKKKKMCCRLRFKNVCENINLPGFPAGIICSVRLLSCSAAGPWPQRGELLSGPAVYCTSPLCSSSSFISSCRPYLPLPALFFTPASLSWKKGKKERRKKKSFLVRKQTLLWLPASPSSPRRASFGLNWPLNVNFYLQSLFLALDVMLSMSAAWLR